MKSVIGSQPAHYRRLNLDENSIAPWEDGLRTDPAATTFEWWYFDCHLDDGSKVTIEFHTKPPFISPASPLTPFISLTVDRPDGTEIRKFHTAEADTFSASRERCDVAIGPSTFAGDMHRYRIHVEIDEVVVDVVLESGVPPWRPATGHVFFGDDEQHYVAWLPVVPRGRVQLTLAVGGDSEQLSGTGYHDHNWGNVALRKIIDHWYWGRARIQDYTVVALMFTGAAEYGGLSFPSIMVAKDGDVLVAAVGPEQIDFHSEETSFDEQTGVPIANRLTYRADAGISRFIVNFERHQDIFMLDFGKAGAYHRFSGDVTLERFENSARVDSIRQDAIWELLYFGTRARRPDSASSAPADSSPILVHEA